jgi:hypothetical protein
MSARYPFKINGFENQSLELQASGFFSSAKILVNGVQAEPGVKKNEVLLRKQDGTTVSVFIQNAFFDIVPRLVVQGETIQVVAPLKWYQYVWCGLTLVLIIYGGAVGSVVSMVGFLLNIRIMRNTWGLPLKYLAVLLSHVVVLVVYTALALLVTVMTGASS